jgi:hypothetical protein
MLERILVPLAGFLWLKWSYQITPGQTTPLQYVRNVPLTEVMGAAQHINEHARIAATSLPR